MILSTVCMHGRDPWRRCSAGRSLHYISNGHNATWVIVYRDTPPATCRSKESDSRGCSLVALTSHADPCWAVPERPVGLVRRNQWGTVATLATTSITHCFKEYGCVFLYFLYRIVKKKSLDKTNNVLIHLSMISSFLFSYWSPQAHLFLLKTYIFTNGSQL